MPLSTSSSDLGPRAFFTLLLRGAAPTVAVALLLLGLAEVWSRQSPARVPETIEDILISEQVRRARALSGKIDVLILGDSSALMGIDPVQLGRLLGDKRVESLALFGYTGAAAYGRLLEILSAHSEIGRVLIMMNGGSLSLEEQYFPAVGIEEMVVGPSSAIGARNKLFYDGVGWIVTFPLPGSFGRHYGWPEDLRRAIHRDRGSLIDPNRRFEERRKTSPYLYSLTPSVESRLKELGKILKTTRTSQVRCGFTPVPRVRDTESSRHSRRAIAEKFIEALGLKADAFLPTPESMPESQFATSTHLSPEGRIEFTKVLADELKR